MRKPLEAKQLLAKALADLEARVGQPARRAESLTELEAHQLAIVAHDRWLQQDRDNPSQQTSWNTNVGERLFGPESR